MINAAYYFELQPNDINRIKGAINKKTCLRKK